MCYVRWALKTFEVVRPALFYGSLQKEAVKLGDCLHSVLVQMADPYQHLLPNNDYIMIDSQNMHVRQVFSFVFHRTMDDILIS